MVFPAPRRALAMALVALLLPLAAAQSEPVVDPEEDVEPPEELECTQPLEECFPDLIPSNPTLENVDERYPSRACTDFINIGAAPTATPFRVRLDIDGIPTAEQQFSKAYQRGEGEANICWDNIQLAGGRHTMTVTVDAYNEVVESDERNNARSLPVTIRYTPRVDLRLTTFTVTPHDGAPRENQIFYVEVTNIGSEVSNATTVSLTDDNGAMADFTLGPLRPGQSAQFAHATRPEYRPVGSFIARAVVDPLGSNAELNELNNDAYLEYVVLEHPAPDLAITDIRLSGNFTEFSGVLARVNVTNIGDQFGRGVLVRAINETGGNIQEAYTPSVLYPNATATMQLRLVLRAGDRTIRFVVDPANAVKERNELNNERNATLTVTKPIVVVHEPNLVVERLYAMPSDPRPGEAVSVGALVKNVGTNKSNATMVNFTIDGVPIGSAQIPALAIDSSYSAYVPWVTTKAGFFSVGAAADGPSKVKELDEDDNTLAMQFLITAIAVPDPDEEEPPTNVTPPVNATPTPPTTPTRPPTAPTPVTNASQRVAFADLVIETREVPGGLKGIISASLRNPSIQTVGLLEVTFKVDGEVLKQVLVSGIRPAASQPATTGEVDLPPGNHTVTAEVRIVNTPFAPIVRSETYEAAAGKKSGIPAPGVPIVLALALALALARRRVV